MIWWSRQDKKLQAPQNQFLGFVLTAKAVAWITANYAKPLHVEQLAQVANMGVSTLHHHFRAHAAMSPLQYQKQLRLKAARSLMLNNGFDAASAARY